MAEQEQTHIEGWAIVDLFGHNHIAGYVRTALIGTSGMLRCDVPEIDDAPAYTRFIGPGAIYGLTLVTEEVAKAALKSIRPPAVTVYIPRERQLEAPEPGMIDLDDYLNEGPDNDNVNEEDC